MILALGIIQNELSGIISDLQQPPAAAAVDAKPRGQRSRWV